MENEALAEIIGCLAVYADSVAASPSLARQLFNDRLRLFDKNTIGYIEKPPYFEEEQAHIHALCNEVENLCLQLRHLPSWQDMHNLANRMTSDRNIKIQRSGHALLWALRYRKPKTA